MKLNIWFSIPCSSITFKLSILHYIKWIKWNECKLELELGRGVGGGGGLGFVEKGIFHFNLPTYHHKMNLKISINIIFVKCFRKVNENEEELCFWNIKPKLIHFSVEQYKGLFPYWVICLIQLLNLNFLFKHHHTQPIIMLWLPLNYLSTSFIYVISLIVSITELYTKMYI